MFPKFQKGKKKVRILRAAFNHTDRLERNSKYQDKFNATLLSIKKTNAKYKNVQAFKLKISKGTNKITELNNAVHNKVDFAIVKSSLFSNNAINSKIKPYFQTLTRSFFNDKPNATKEEMQEFITQINHYLKENPYKDWTNKKQEWNGAIYEKIYGPKTSLVSGYRGMILISGTKTELIAIRKAWTNKDWNTFVNFGILVGKKFNKAKYVLPNKLLIKNFGTQADLNKNKTNNKISFGLDSLKLATIGNSPKFKIVFTYANSFAWTQNKVRQTPLYTPKNVNERIEVLTYTNQSLYDVGVFNINYSELEKELITQTFIALSKEGEDALGTFSGYNGYQKITDIKQFYKDVK